MAIDISKADAFVLTRQVTVITPTAAADGADDVATAALTGVDLGDIVIAGPTTALPTNQIYTGAYVSATDTLSFTFGAVGAVTGASRVFNVQVYKKAV